MSFTFSLRGKLFYNTEEVLEGVLFLPRAPARGRKRPPKGLQRYYITFQGLGKESEWLIPVIR